MASREKVAQDLRHAAARVDAAIGGLSEEQASSPAIDGWSVKDHLTHLTVWHEMRFFEISRVGRGGRSLTPTFGDVNAFNETLGSMRRGLSLEQALADLAFAREMVQRAVAECPEDRLDSKHYLEASPAGGVDHETEHADHIAGWRKTEGL
ncbi:MAG: DinB family protein [Hyphomicrobiales bacterium]